MKYYFRPKSLDFYLSGFHTTIPEDVVEVTTKDFLTYGVGIAPVGMTRHWDGEKITWKQEVHPESELYKKERDWRNSELLRSDIELNKVQDSDPKAVGTVSDWRAYRKALRAWPEHSGFPNTDLRPTSPCKE